MNDETNKVNKYLIIKKIAAVLALVLINLFLSVNVMAFEAFEIKGQHCGLRIESKDEVETDNLNPGDLKKAYITLSNEGVSTLTTSMKSKVITEKKIFGFGGGDLDDKLILTISQENQILYQGSLSGLENPAIDLGSLPVNESSQLTLEVSLPGPGTDNNYQGASVSVKWIFTTTCSSSNGNGGNGGNGSNGSNGSNDDNGNGDENGNGNGDPEDNDVVIIDDPEPPGGPIDPDIQLPDTGELPPGLFYVIGLLIIATGVGMRYKLKS